MATSPAEKHDEDAAIISGLRNSARIACIVFTLATTLLLAATRTAVAPSSLAFIVLSLAGGTLLYACYRWVRPDPYLSTIFGGLTILVWAGFLASSTALAALRTGAPLIDGDLARVDALLGVHTPSLVAWLAQNDVMIILAPAYRSTVPLVFLAVILLSVMRREKAVWELCLSFTASAALCTFPSAIIPAAGTFVHYTMPHEAIASLPSDAGIYYLAMFNSYRSGIFNTVAISHFQGVVTFPSFHTAMALMFAYSLRSVRWLFVPACIWSGLTILSTMPMGGHYAADVVAGAAIWAFCTLPYPLLVERARAVALIRTQSA